MVMAVSVDVAHAAHRAGESAPCGAIARLEGEGSRYGVDMEAVDRSVFSRGRGVVVAAAPVSPAAASGIAIPLAGEVDGLALVPILSLIHI